MDPGLHRALFESAPEGILVLDGSTCVECNASAAALFGCSREDLLGTDPLLGWTRPGAAPPDAAARVRGALEAARAGAPQEFEWRFARRDGTLFEAEAAVRRLDGAAPGLTLVTLRGLGRRRGVESAIRAVAASTLSRSGAAFVDTLVVELARVLKADYVFAGEVQADRRVRVLSLCAGGELAGGFDYALDGTPCANVVGHEACFYPAGVQRLFPEDRLLADMAIEGYVGVPLTDSHGDPLGLLVALSREPIAHADLAQSVLELFAARAAAEMERTRTEAALGESERRSRSIVDSMPVGMLRYRLEADGALRLEGVNPAAVRILGMPREELLGRALEEAFPALASSDLPEAYRRVALGGEPFHRDQVEYEDGRVHGAFEVQAFRAAPGEVVVAFLDVTGRVRAAEALREREARLARVNRVLAAVTSASQRIARARDEQALLQDVCDSLVAAGDFRWASVALTDQPDGPARIAAASPPAQAGRPFDCALGGGHHPECPLTAVETRRPLWLDTSAHPDCRLCPGSGPAEAKVLLALPLLRGERCLGVLSVQPRGEQPPGPEEQPLLEDLAGSVALALEGLRSEGEVRRRVETLLALHETGVELGARRELRPLLGAIVDRAKRLTGGLAGGMYLAQPDGMLEMMFADGPLAPFVGLRLKPGQGASGRVAETKESILIDHYSHWSNRGSAFEGLPIGSVMSVPVLWREEVLGVLFVEHEQPGRFGAAELEVVTLFADQAAVALANARLFEQLDRAYAELGNAYDATLEGWVTALDLRDKETEGHTQRVSRMTVELARVMGVPEDQLVHIRRGALLHDIGKIGIPDRILLKPGPLTPDEWVVMKQHTQHAYAMLSPISYLRPAIDIPWCHHEKVDGTGYPRGLKGDEIPLAARIFAVVDVWDALSYDRPYRSAQPADEVRAYIRSVAGTHLDPAVVDAFLEKVCPGR